MEGEGNSLNENSISEILKENLIAPNFELGQDYAEMAIDALISSEAWKDAPFIATGVRVVKTINSFKEAIEVKKLLSFLKQFHSGKLPEDKMTEFRIKMEDDLKYKNRVVEQIIVMNSRFVEIEKSKIYANLFIAHLNGSFGWQDFVNVSICLERFHLAGLDYLHKIALGEGEGNKPFYNRHDNKEEFGKAFLIAAGMASQWVGEFQVNYLGQYIYKYGIEGDINYKFKPAE